MPTPADLNLPVEFGSAASVETQGTGWFIGYSAWCRSGGHDLRHMARDAEAHGLCVKWFAHEPGHPDGEPKPLSTGRTVSLLACGESEFVLEFSGDAAFDPARTATHVLQHAGDYAMWGAGVHHRAFARRRATIITVRWELGPAPPHLA
jgi:hypothetical protein